MPLNDRKIIKIILNECEFVEERCEGYKEEIREVISDIFTLERQNIEQGTNIQQKITGKCQATGDFLLEKRNTT